MAFAIANIQREMFKGGQWCCSVMAPNVLDGERVLLLVAYHPDAPLVAARRGVGQRQEARLVQRVRTVRDQLTQEDLLLRVERVDDDVLVGGARGSGGRRARVARGGRGGEREREAMVWPARAAKAVFRRPR